MGVGRVASGWWLELLPTSAGLRSATLSSSPRSSLLAPKPTLSLPGMEIYFQVRFNE
ncbi:hypothetical protein [Chroococcidiopsis sp.]|uniref:hypothetical protein n=1 Tax=Chroococcidiopsis sp. TaxID=3088168 RepID=UPI003F3D626D